MFISINVTEMSTENIKSMLGTLVEEYSKRIENQEGREFINKHPYQKQLYFNINNPNLVVEAVNKKNAKNILKCKEENIKNVHGVLKYYVSKLM